MSVERIQQEDLLVWPDGTTCYYHELSEMSHMSDDFEVVRQDTARYEQLTSP